MGRHCVTATWIIVYLTASTCLQAARLPVRVYAPADGLPGISIHRIRADPKGFLWFCTNEGVSRFDGYRFTTYGKAAGLSDPNTYDVIYAGEDYWIGTASGLYRLSAGSVQSGTKLLPQKLLTGEPPLWVEALMADSPDLIWVGTRSGLFRLERHTPTKSGDGSDWRLRPVELPDGAAGRPLVTSLLRDRQRRLWVGTGRGLYLIGRDGVDYFSSDHGLPGGILRSLALDSRGRVWAGAHDGLSRLLDQPDPQGRIVDLVYLVRDGLPGPVKALLTRADGSLWAGMRGGVLRIDPAAVPQNLPPAYTTAHGLSDDDIESLGEDADRNLWIGTNSGGSVKLSASGFVTYGPEDGLGSAHVMNIIEDRDGSLSVVSRASGNLYLNRFDGGRFHSRRLEVPADYYPATWFGYYQVLVHGLNREWWAASGSGLLRFPPGQNPGPRFRRYTAAHGLVSEQIHQIFEDSQGRLWISIRRTGGTNAIMMRSPGSDVFHAFSQADGVPPLHTMYANGFFEDRIGQIWIGLHRQGVLRYARGRFRAFLTSDGVPPGGIRRFHEDRAGRLWMGSGHGGVARVDNPAADTPRFIVYDSSRGLAGDEVQAITEDASGRIYIGTGHAIDRLDPRAGTMRRYTTADGLAPGEIQAALRDRQGDVWFGTVRGLSKLLPDTEAVRPPPPVRILAIRIDGQPYSLSDAGETKVTLPDLPANRNVQIDFTAISFASGDLIRYQYRLQDADADWSGPVPDRSVVYPRLPPGQYRFQVRSVNLEGLSAGSPADVHISILRPIWMRWWFLALALSITFTAIYVIHRHRVMRLLEVERLRTRLAADLHDEIGSGLSQIAVLSEVVKSRMRGDASDAATTLERVAALSRELVDAMADLVWSTNPRRDTVGDLMQRMRRFAQEMASARDIQLTFETIGGLAEQKIDYEVRRHVYLIFRELIRNAVRHSRCTRISVRAGCEDDRFILQVVDDGTGFDPSAPRTGHGLDSLRTRSRALKGTLEWRRNSGTVATLTIPLHEQVGRAGRKRA